MGQAEESAGYGAAQETESQLVQWQRAFFARLGEIRRRLMVALLSFAAFAIAGFAVSQRVLDSLSARHPDSVELIFLGPTEAFVARIKLALGIGFIGAFPLLLGQVWSLAAPYLQRRQRIISFLLIPLSYALFLGGVVVAYEGILPMALRFLLGFRSEELRPMLSVSPYVSFVILLVLPLALLFQLPIIVMFLARIGVLRPRSLAERRKYAILLFFVVGAILTPPDVFSQILLAIPLIVLFEVSLLFARLVAPRERDDDE